MLLWNIRIQKEMACTDGVPPWGMNAGFSERDGVDQIHNCTINEPDV